MTAVLAVDLGKTGCRAALFTGHTDRPHAVLEVSGAPGLATPGGVAAAEAAVLAAVAPLVDEERIDAPTAVCVGAAGAAAAPDAARLLAERLLQALPVPEAAVTSDAVTAHAGALGGAAGVVLAAGTGAVAVGVGTDGTFTRADGWGPLLGDEGSGGWIGLAGLRAALRAHDGRGADTVLRQAAAEAFGELDRLPLTLSQGDNPARVAASFAPVVGRSAQAGDRVAAGIMGAAAAALAESVVAAAKPLQGSGPLPVAVTGGLTGLGAPLLDPLHTALAAAGLSLRVEAPLGDPLHGAGWLARHRDTPHEPLVARVRRRRRAAPGAPR